MLDFEQRRERNRKWRAENPETSRSGCRIYHARNAAEIAERKRRYYQEVRKVADRTDEGRFKDRSRKARRRGAIPSTAALGVESWMASLAASRASRIASPESARAATTNATSGPTLGASSSSPAPGSSSSRTSAACSRRSPASIRARYGSGVTYSDWVSTLREDCSRRQKSAQAMSASASLSSQWPTQAGLKLLDNDQTSLQSSEEQSMWPTPTANCVDMDTMERSGTAGYVRIAQKEAGSPYLAQVSGVLNPAFVEWMMGWPIGSTASACSATALSLFKQRMRFALSQLASPAAAPPAQLALFA
jgi:hypothetical protein